MSTIWDRRAVHVAEPHLHELEQRETENVGGPQKSHGESQRRLAQQRQRRESAGEVRAVAAAVCRREEPGETHREPAKLRGAGGPRRAGDAEAESEYEQLVEECVRDRHHERDAQRDGRAADAVEESQDGVERDAERRSEHSRKPVRQGEIERGRGQPERREQGSAAHRENGEKRQREQRAPQGRSRSPARRVRSAALRRRGPPAFARTGRCHRIAV